MEDFDPKLNFTLEPINNERKYLCGSGNLREEICDNIGKMKTVNVGALAIFITSELLQGIFGSPKYSLSMTYIDDNTKKNSPVYFCKTHTTLAMISMAVRQFAFGKLCNCH